MGHDRPRALQPQPVDLVRLDPAEAVAVGDAVQDRAEPAEAVGEGAVEIEDDEAGPPRRGSRAISVRRFSSGTLRRSSSPPGAQSCSSTPSSWPATLRSASTVPNPFRDGAPATGGPPASAQVSV